ncbi:MAG: transcription antitermination factor NusB [Actinomycetota bacterium]|nr:transcription antitermination factor NusB [Actinomycetota bacterium]
MSARKTAPRRASAARIMALQAIMQIRERKAYAKQVVETMVEQSGLPEQERAFATLLTYGVVSCLGVLDEVIDDNLRRPGSIQDDVRDCLRISVYEIVFLRKSAYAAVDQGVELVKTVAPRAAGLANAVLRKISDSAKDFPWGDPATDMAALARSYGYPTWIVERAMEDRGRLEVQRMLEASSHETPPVFIAANPFKVSDAEAREQLQANGIVVRAMGAPGCFLANDGQAVAKCRLLEDGTALVSDAAAQVVAMLATPEQGSTYLEVGSGRGTKTILLQGNCLRASGGTAHLYALDIHGFKGEVLTERMQRYGVPDVVAMTGDVRDLDGIDGLPASFDGCLIDAPCTGLGTLRRHPEQRWRVQSADVEVLADNGLAMLSSVSGRIAPGGFIVYSTCTFTHAENEGVIARFLASEAGTGFEVASLAGRLPDDFNDCLTPEGFFRSTPRRGGADGHFAAKLVRHA